LYGFTDNCAGITSRIEHAEAATPLYLIRKIETVGHFLRAGNDAIQPIEKSASKLLNRNERDFGVCGLQMVDARGCGEKTGFGGVTDVNNQNINIPYRAGRSIFVSRKEPNRLSF
jgi:hypothetical protein